LSAAARQLYTVARIAAIALYPMRLIFARFLNVPKINAMLPAAGVFRVGVKFIRKKSFVYGSGLICGYGRNTRKMRSGTILFLRAIGIYGKPHPGSTIFSVAIIIPKRKLFES
jgi:hypothetical protein